MRILLIGAGAVGAAIARIAARRDFFDGFTVADYNAERAAAVVEGIGDERFHSIFIDANSTTDVAAAVRDTDTTIVVNACDPRFVMPIFNGAFEAGAHYLDMAMSLSQPHPEQPYALPGVLLGEEQFAQADRWKAAGLLALTSMGVEPGLSDVFARYAADHLFAEIDEIGVRDGGNLTVEGYEFAPTFSIWTTIEECLNPPLIWEAERGLYTTPPLSEPEIFEFPEGIGPVECVNVEHEEVILIPKWVQCKKVTFKYGLGAQFINVLQVLRATGMHRTETVNVNGVEVRPRDVLAAALPDPATLGDKMQGKTCAGILVTGIGLDGNRRSVYLYHVVDNADTMRDYECQAVAWQTAINPVVAMELLATGRWSGVGVLGPEAFDAVPFLDLLNQYGSPWGIQERTH